MKRRQYAMLGCLCALLLSACSREAAPQDFWEATLEALEPKLTINHYEEGNWDIGVELKEMAEDPKHRSLTIRQIEEKQISDTQNEQHRAMFSLQNEDGQKQISYIYERSETEDDIERVQRIEVASNDSFYYTYTIQYTDTYYESGNFQNQEEAKGTLHTNGTRITYDNVPLLRETMERAHALLEDFQREFQIDYAQYDFTDIPQMAVLADIPELGEIPEETATTTDYFSEPSFNARGHSLITFMRFAKDGSYIEYGTYDASTDEQYFSHVTLEDTAIPDVYHLVSSIVDPDIEYACCIKDDVIYLYTQKTTDEEIAQDVQANQGENAIAILKTTNEGIDHYHEIFTQRNIG